MKTTTKKHMEVRGTCLSFLSCKGLIVVLSGPTSAERSCVREFFLCEHRRFWPRVWDTVDSSSAEVLQEDQPRTIVNWVNLKIGRPVVDKTRDGIDFPSVEIRFEGYRRSQQYFWERRTDASLSIETTFHVLAKRFSVDRCFDLLPSLRDQSFSETQQFSPCSSFRGGLKAKLLVLRRYI